MWAIKASQISGALQWKYDSGWPQWDELDLQRAEPAQTASKAGISLVYTYDASGNKLRKVSSTAGTRDYVNGIEYNAGVIELIHTEEGIARRKVEVTVTNII